MSAPVLSAPSTKAVPPPSEYADQMQLLREFAALDSADPRRALLREDIILAFLPVVDHIVRRHSSGQPSLVEDLRQAGTVALINAVDRWDPDLARGEFLGYLIPCVRGEVLRWFRDRTWAMRVPRALKELSVVISRVTGPLSQELGREPRPRDLAEHLGVGVAEIIEALDAKANHHAWPLDMPDQQTGTPLIDLLGAADRELDRVEFRHAVRPLLAALPERERTVVMLRFFGEMTQTQIAEQLGISQMHVSRLLSRTLGHLRRELLEDPAR